MSKDEMDKILKGRQRIQRAAAGIVSTNVDVITCHGEGQEGEYFISLTIFTDEIEGTNENYPIYNHSSKEEGQRVLKNFGKIVLNLAGTRTKGNDDKLKLNLKIR